MGDVGGDMERTETTRGLFSFPLMVAVIGCALFSIWFQGSKGVFEPVADEGLAELCSLLVKGFDLAFLLAIALFSSRVRSLVARPRLMVATACAISFATLGLLPSSPAAILVIAASLQGMVRAVLALVWMELFSRFGMRKACVGFSLGSFLGVAFSWLVDTMPLVPSELAVGFCGLASAVLALVQGWPQGVGASIMEPFVKKAVIPLSNREVETGSWSFPLHPTVLLSAYALGFTVVSTFCGDYVKLYPRGFSSAVAALLMFVATSTRSDKKGALLIGAASLPLASLGIIAALVPTLGLGPTFFAGIGYQFFATFLYVLLFDLSYRYGVNPLWLFGFTRAPRVAMAFFVPMLSGVFPDIGQGAALQYLLTAVLIILIATAYLYPMAWGTEATLGIRQVDPKQDDAEEDLRASATAKGIQDSLERVAYVYGLTKREEEVLALLAAGMTTTQIEGALFISKGTARNHVRHIYEKTGVHSRDELKSRIDEV